MWKTWPIFLYTFFNMKEKFDLNLIWNETIEKTKSKLTEAERGDFENISGLTRLADIDHKQRGVVVLKDKFSKVLWQSNFSLVVQESFQEITSSEYTLITIDKEDYSEATKERAMEDFIVESSVENSNLVSKFTFDNFVVTKFNRLLVNAAKAVVMRPGNSIANPFFIYGGSGLGKTHLVNAVGNEVKKRNNILKVRYIEAKELARITQDAFKQTKGMIEKIEKIKSDLSAFDVLIFDDIQFIETKAKTKEIFFHVFNDLLLKDKQVIITADRHPEEMKSFEDRILTRFQQGFTEDVSPPDVLTSKEIIKQKLVERWPQGKEIFTDEAIEFVAQNFAANVRDLEAALNRIILFSDGDLEHKIDLDIVEDIFKGMKKVKSGRTHASIISEVGKYYAVPVKEIKGTSRIKEIALARQISMYLIKEVLDETYVNIATEFQKDHSTIISSIRKIDKLYNESDDMHKVIQDLRRKIG